MAPLQATESGLVREALYQAALEDDWQPAGLFAVPQSTVRAWGERAFTRSYLRSFLTFCTRTKVSEWIARLEHCKERKRDPWQKKEAEAEALVQALRQWQGSNWVSEQWDQAVSNQPGLPSQPMPACREQTEKLRIAREQMATALRQAIRCKPREGDGDHASQTHSED